MSRPQFTCVLALVCFSSVALAQQPEPRPVRSGRKYSVTIDSVPQQAAIYLDDKKYGIWNYTPWTGRLTKGDYTLIIDLPGHAPYVQRIRIDHTSRMFMATLVKQVLPGKVDVQASADPNVNGASVFVDGLVSGTAPAEIELRDGRHQVELRKSGFQDFSQWLTVAQGQRLVIAPVLRPVVVARPKGSLLVDADAADAEVFVDGQRQPDTTPTLVDDLEEGQYLVEVRKPPSTPWKQTVSVKSGQRTKIMATLTPAVPVSQPVAPLNGSLRIIANVAETEVWLDGMILGPAPADVKNIAPGEHLVECKAKGFASVEQRAKITAGSAEILKCEMVSTVTSPSDARVKVVSPVPEAKVFIDGAAVGSVPVERILSAGEHFVVVEKEGYARFEQKLVVEAGQVLTVTAQLRAMGRLRFLSTPDGADIKLDGEVIGKTPFLAEDIEVGRHVIEIHLDGFQDWNGEVTVEGGKLGIVNAALAKAASGPSPEDVHRIKWALSSWGARVMPYRRFTTDIMTGFPYWLEARATVGVADKRTYGWDVGIGVRTLFTTWEFLGNARYRFFQKEPFAFAGFGSIGGGGGLAGRNEFTTQAGVLGTITFQGSGGSAVTITGRAYLDLWSDRLCGLAEGTDLVHPDAPEVCRTFKTSPNDEEVVRAKALTGNDDLLERDVGLRLMLSFIAEVAVNEQFSVFLVFEGPPLQDERAAYADIFNGTMFERDPTYNGKVGLTIKF